MEGFSKRLRAVFAGLVPLLAVSCGGEGGPSATGASPAGSPPVAVIAASAAEGEAPLEVEFSALASSDPDGAIAAFRWDFGDGSEPCAGEIVRHVYCLPGTYAASLTVWDAGGARGAAEAAIRVLEARCPSFAPGVVAGSIEAAEVVEASGIAASRKNPGVLWVHNDSGDAARIFAMALDGRHLGTYAISGAAAYDWEDIAVGPGPEPGESYIFLGDIGDNARARSCVTVYRVPEPVVDLDEAPAQRAAGGAVALAMVYPEGPADAECLMVDPVSRDIFIVTKEADGRSRVYRNPFPQPAGPRSNLELVATLAFGTGALPGSALVTAGDISPLGNWIILRTYSRAFLWLRPLDRSVGAAFLGAPCPVPSAPESQGEAIAFSADGRAYVTVSEGSHSAVRRFDRTP
ncbi:MAG: PKD domain-containing protein [Planctomycetota bacterium]